MPSNNKNAKTKESPERESTKSLDMLAWVLTNVFSPVTASLVGVFVIFANYISTDSHPGYDWLLAALLFVVLSLGTLLVFMKLKLISNWDISDRTQRPKLLALLCGYFIILILITEWLGYSQAVPILVLVTFGMMVASFITLFWKISFHTFSVTLTIVLILFTYGSSWIYLLFITPVITAWTRVHLRKHTLKQVIGGIMLGLAIGVVWAAIRIALVLTLVSALNNL